MHTTPLLSFRRYSLQPESYCYQEATKIPVAGSWSRQSHWDDSMRSVWILVNSNIRKLFFKTSWNNQNVDLYDTVLSKKNKINIQIFYLWSMYFALFFCWKHHIKSYIWYMQQKTIIFILLRNTLWLEEEKRKT